MAHDREFELRLFVVKTGYDALDFSDGPPLLEHFKTIEELEGFLLAHGVGVDEVAEAAWQLSQGKNAKVFGRTP